MGQLLNENSELLKSHGKTLDSLKFYSFFFSVIPVKFLIAFRLLWRVTR